ncbi:DUF1800 domain-containing protein [Dyadobacter luteus]|uniref:DUF1800 domain-containing protein n=1 Tax=Dyadobacter luteus TaxID=2259619 RepID=A0A3D8YDE6_9BACT|nr:DUF1800 family protein [Dyadobacter luteus]REA62493.1 DUF1800 domain-containing protein [Dyadobacter luteus]
MAYLDTYTPLLTAQTAAHLLRRATYGPTQSEITSFTGLTASQAVDLLFENIPYTLNADTPVDLDETKPTGGQPFINAPYNNLRSYNLSICIKHWWVGLMAVQNGRPSVLEKLATFWQNHFVVSQLTVLDYRMTYSYLQLIRSMSTGNFRTFCIEMTKDAAMLLFQNGNENQKIRPNENYARELQELFVVGQKDFYGNLNYTEDDVRAAARALTGWQVSNYLSAGSTSFGVSFNEGRHDTDEKKFSSKYANRSIPARIGATSGERDIEDLIDILLSHGESSKFIVRKLYRWYVNNNVTAEIEDNVIVPLANFFVSSENNYNIGNLLKKLLTSDIFYDVRNRGAIIKSPAEVLIGLLRFFDQPVPDFKTDFVAFRKYTQFVIGYMDSLQLNFLNQPLVFGSVPYYQSGYSKNWINGTAIGFRNNAMEYFIYPYVEIKPGTLLGRDMLVWITSMQPNFNDVEGTDSISCEYVFSQMSKNLFAIELNQSQTDFLIDTIMMQRLPRNNWINEWTRYRLSPANVSRQDVVKWRCLLLMRYMLRMAEFHVF